MSDTTEALIAFLNARLAEKETAARDLLRTAQNAALAVQEPHMLGKRVPGWHSWGDVEALCESALREVEAMRAILDRHSPHDPAFGGPACNWCSEDVDDRPQIAKERWPCPDVRSLAANWSDHPDFDPGWKP